MESKLGVHQKQKAKKKIRWLWNLSRGETRLRWCRFLAPSRSLAVSRNCSDSDERIFGLISGWSSNYLKIGVLLKLGLTRKNLPLMLFRIQSYIIYSIFDTWFVLHSTCTGLLSYPSNCKVLEGRDTTVLTEPWEWLKQPLCRKTIALSATESRFVINYYNYITRTKNLKSEGWIFSKIYRRAKLIFFYFNYFSPPSLNPFREKATAINFLFFLLLQTIILFRLLLLQSTSTLLLCCKALHSN